MGALESSLAALEALLSSLAQPSVLSWLQWPLGLLSLTYPSLLLLALSSGVTERSEAERERAKRELQSELMRFFSMGMVC